MAESFDRRDAGAFLRALFSEAPENLRFLVWTLPKKFSLWYPGGEGGVEAALESVGKAWVDRDVYVGGGLSPRDFGLTQRCPAAEIAGIVGLWLDLDVAHAVHKKPNLPPSTDAALGMLDEIGVEPSFVVESGHGLQVWWLFSEPWVFAGDSERQRAAELMAAWIANVRIRAKKRGWAVDSVIDLSRVMRLPGTVNRKHEPVPVRIIADSGARYEVEDLSGVILEEAWQEASRNVAITGAAEIGVLKTDPDAHPPFASHDAMLENDDRYRKTWEHKRKDLADQSPSGYDMALANILVRAGWSDQEIVDTLIAHRRKYNADLKLREDYYKRTIMTAHDSPGASDQKQTEEKLSRIETVQADPEVKGEDKRKTTLEEVSALLGVRVTRFVKYKSDPPSYRLFVGERGVPIGSSADLQKQPVFSAAVIDVCSYVMPTFKPPQWRKIVQALLHAAEEVDVSDDATEEGGMRLLLHKYLSEKPPVEDRAMAAEVSRPFLDCGDIYIFSKNFCDWLNGSQREKLSLVAVCTKLRSFGSEPKTFSKKKGGVATTTSAWRIPAKIIE